MAFKDYKMDPEVVAFQIQNGGFLCVEMAAMPCDTVMCAWHRRTNIPLKLACHERHAIIRL